MCNMSCGHVSMYKQKKGICSYEILHAFYVSCIAKNSLARKAQDCVCRTDRCRSYQRIHACLYCIYFGCFNNRHIHEHARAEDHILAVDTNYGHVYCFECGDYQYDAAFERIAQDQYLIASHKKGIISSKMEANMAEATELKKEHQVINVAKMGLRGIVNMGNTCYISVILQSLVHAPLFRDYFLTLQHKCSFQNDLSTLGSQVLVSDSTEPPVCFACEISDIVQEFFSGKKEPFVPNRLLHLLWTREDELKGYKQQDAHEFFLKLLNHLHLNCQGPIESSVGDHLCKCIIDRIFTGFSEYVYTCQQCPNEYSENTPFKDLVLISQTSTTKSSTTDVSLLPDCLKKSLMYVVPEVLCSTCLETRPFNVRITLKKLPLIISFHVNQLCSTKKFISFPEMLDMTPYIFSQRSQSSEEDMPLASLDCSNNMFYLFAVVEHKGDENSGHYVCYVRRHQSDWFLCNDKIVKQVKIEDVLKKKAYLLFYHKQLLEYKDAGIKNEDQLSTSRKLNLIHTK